MRRIHTCRICGTRSENEQKISRCEQQGENNLYALKQKVVFLKDKEEVLGIVSKVAFASNTHHPFYQLSIEGKGNITIAERNILRAEPAQKETI